MSPSITTQYWKLKISSANIPLGMFNLINRKLFLQQQFQLRVTSFTCHLQLFRVYRLNSKSDTLIFHLFFSLYFSFGVPTCKKHQRYIPLSFTSLTFFILGSLGSNLFLPDSVSNKIYCLYSHGPSLYHACFMQVRTIQWHVFELGTSKLCNQIH